MKGRWIVGVFSAVAMLTAGCAGPEAVVTARAERQVVSLNAESFDFTPQVIRTHPGEVILDVENVSRMVHNITVKDPAGKILVSRGLPARETVRIAVPLAGVGDYPFYCDKPMHPTLGMKGRIEVR